MTQDHPKNRRHRRNVAALLLAIAMFAASCGNDDEGGGGGSGTLEGETLTVAAVWSGDEQEDFTQVLEAFEEETGAKVNFTSTGDDIASVLGTSIAGGSPPDVAVLPQPGLLRDLAGAGNLVALDDIAGEVVDENFASHWRELGTVDDKLYGVWFKAANKSTVWYNVAALKDAGVEPPENWDDFVAAAQALSDSGVTPISVGGADGWTLTDWFENVYIRTAGAEKYDQLSTHAIPWTDPSVVEALNKMGELIGKNEWVAKGLSGALQVDFPASVAQVFSDPPAAAIVYEGDFVAGEIESGTDATVGEDANFFPFPSIDDSEPAVIGGGDVAVLLKDTEAGRELIKFLASAEAAEVWAELGGFTSPNKNVDSDVYPDDISRANAEEVVNADVFRFDMSDLQPSAFGGTSGQGLWKGLQDWLANPARSAEIAASLEAAAAAAFAA